MRQDVVSNEDIDELKKKVLELCDTIDKQNEKYRKALMIAADELEGAVLEDAGCYYSCPIVDFCDADETECTEQFLQHWKEEAGIE